MSNEIKERTVYMLCRTDKVEDDVYVGSTSCPLEKRFSHHKYNAGNPSRLKYYGNSKLYKRMREVGIERWKIVPLLTFACNRETICEFEFQWVKALNADLNTLSPVDEDLFKRKYRVKYYKKNIQTKRYYCELCDVACMHNRDLKKHFDSLKHSYAWLNAVD